MRDIAMRAVDKIFGEFDDKKVTKKDMENDKSGKSGQDSAVAKKPRRKRVRCPHCGRNHMILL